MDRTNQEGYNLNISRYISTADADEEVKLEEVNSNLVNLEEQILKAKNTHNQFLAELGLPKLP